MRPRPTPPVVPNASPRATAASTTDSLPNHTSSTPPMLNRGESSVSSSLLSRPSTGTARRVAPAPPSTRTLPSAPSPPPGGEDGMGSAPNSARSPLRASAGSSRPASAYTGTVLTESDEPIVEKMTASSSAGDLASDETSSGGDTKSRHNVVKEILSSERSYIQSIEEMMTKYKAPLLSMQAADPSISGADMKTLFGNLHILLPVNKELYTNLENRIANWSSTAMLGDVFTRTIPFLKLYVDYASNYQGALDVYNKYMAQSPTFAELCQVQKTRVEGKLSLEHLLIMPIQRIPRYSLLLQDLIRLTPPEHPDLPGLQKALAATKDVADHINETVRKTENLKRLAQQSTKGAGFRNLMEAHRQLVLDSSLVCVLDNSGKKEKVNVYLFNDIFVYASKTDVKKQLDMSKLDTQFSLNLVWVDYYPSHLDITTPSHTLTLFLSPEDINKWPKTFQEVQAAYLKERYQDDLPPPDVRVGEFEFGAPEDKCVYEGQWLKGKPHGDGTYRFHGNTYTGQFEYGKRSGRGSLTFANGSQYEGQFFGDRFNGSGTMWFGNSATYQGQWKDSRKHGEGTLWYANKDTYTGGWRDDMAHGEGRLEMASGANYVGGFLDGKFHGVGTLTMPDKSFYKGGYTSGQRDGQGTLSQANGYLYEGSWKNGKKHGHGRLVFAYSHMKEYTGEFVKGERDGRGKLVFHDESVYDGQFKNNQFNGSGTMVFPGGDIYTGAWKGNQMHGAGVYVYAGGGLEVSGRWNHGVREAKGTVKVTQQNTDAIGAVSSATSSLQGTWVSPLEMSFNLGRNHTEVYLTPPELLSFDWSM